MPLGTVSENRVWVTTKGTDGESAGICLRRRRLKMLIQVPVWCDGALNIKERKIRREFKRRALDYSTLRSGWDIPREMSHACLRGGCKTLLEWNLGNKWESVAQKVFLSHR